MDLHLSDRVVLVAGSSRGIGKATAHAFLTESCRTVITGRQSESLLQTKSEFEAEFGSERVMVCKGDLTQSDVIQKTLVHGSDLPFQISKNSHQFLLILFNLGTSLQYNRSTAESSQLVPR